MARKYFTDFDLNGNQIIGVRLENLAATPTAGNAGRLFFNTATLKVELDSGASFGPLASEAFVNNAVGNAGGGDMTKAAYDSNDDGTVDAADSTPWAGVTGKPTEFPPAAHNQTASTISDFNVEVDGRIVTYFDTVAGADENLDTLRELIDKIKANETALDAIIGRHAEDIGDGSATSIAVAHGLNSLDVTVEVYEKASGATVGVDVVRTNANTVTIGTNAPLASGSHRVVVKY